MGWLLVYWLISVCEWDFPPRKVVQRFDLIYDIPSCNIIHDSYGNDAFNALHGLENYICRDRIREKRDR